MAEFGFRIEMPAEDLVTAVVGGGSALTGGPPSAAGLGDGVQQWPQRRATAEPLSLSGK
jgi:hypothetical protein